MIIVLSAGSLQGPWPWFGTPTNEGVAHLT